MGQHKPTPVEDILDDLLRHIGGGPFGVLDFVRNRLHDLLHPVARFIDQCIDTLWQFTVDVFNVAKGWVADALSAVRGWIGDVYHFVHGLVDDVYRTVVGWIGDVYHFVHGLVDGAIKTAADALGKVWDFIRGAVADALKTVVGWIADVYHFVHGLVDEVYKTAAGWIADTQRFVHGLVDDVFKTVVGWIADVYHFVYGLVDETVTWAGREFARVLKVASDALDWLRRNVIDPIVGKFESFIGHEWAWALQLLRAVEKAAEWIVAIGEFSFEDALAAWQFLTSSSKVGAWSIMQQIRDDKADNVTELRRWAGR